MLRILPHPCRLSVFFGLALGAVLLAPSAPGAAAGDWERIAIQGIRVGAEREVVPVTATEGRFRKLQLRVARSAMHIHDLKVHYGDGTVQDIHVSAKLAAGSSSRIIDLMGDARVIREIEVVYGKVERSRRPARLAIWGMQ